MSGQIWCQGVALALAAGACGNDSSPSKGPPPTLADVAKVTFVAGVDHPYLPLKVGAHWTYRAQTEDGVERTEVEVLAETRTIQGVVATVVSDTLYLDDVLTEDTRDWYAQDATGTVWYLGEDTCEYQNGACANRGGSWTWGVDGALPGVAMPAAPTVDGQPYYQEYYPGEAEDVGEVIAVGASATVPAGSYSDCIKTHDTSTLERSANETKTYCRGVGLVAEDEPDLRAELQSVTGL